MPTISTNIPALNATRSLTNSGSLTATQINSLQSGVRVKAASDTANAGVVLPRKATCPYCESIVDGDAFTFSFEGPVVKGVNNYTYNGLPLTAGELLNNHVFVLKNVYDAGTDTWITTKEINPDLSGIVVKGIAGESLDIGNIVYINDADGKMYLYDGTDRLLSFKALGVVLIPCVLDGDVFVQTEGVLEIFDFSGVTLFDKGKTYYCSAVGELTDTETTLACGVAIDETSLQLRFDVIPEAVVPVPPSVFEGYFSEGTHVGLVFEVNAGQVTLNNEFTAVTGDSLLLADSSISYIGVDLTGAFIVNNTGFTDEMIPLYEVTTDATDITGVVDRRTPYCGVDLSVIHTQNTDYKLDDYDQTIIITGLTSIDFTAGATKITEGKNRVLLTSANSEETFTITAFPDYIVKLYPESDLIINIVPSKMLNTELGLTISLNGYVNDFVKLKQE